MSKWSCKFYNFEKELGFFQEGIGQILSKSFVERCRSDLEWYLLQSLLNKTKPHPFQEKDIFVSIQEFLISCQCMIFTKNIQNIPASHVPIMASLSACSMLAFFHAKIPLERDVVPNEFNNF